MSRFLPEGLTAICPMRRHDAVIYTRIYRDPQSSPENHAFHFMGDVDRNFTDVRRLTLSSRRQADIFVYIVVIRR